MSDSKGRTRNERKKTKARERREGRSRGQRAGRLFWHYLQAIEDGGLLAVVGADLLALVVLPPLHALGVSPDIGHLVLF